MKMIVDVPRVDQLLTGWQSLLGMDYEAYRNHVYRVINLAMAYFPDMSPEQRDLLCIAAAYHDIGIWTHSTLDYLESSADQACAYLAKNPDAGDSSLETKQRLVSAMIYQHHRIRAIPGDELAAAEAFRKADWADVTLGVRRFGLPRGRYRLICASFPNAGFHRRLLTLFTNRLRESPLSPLPMLRW